MPNPTPAAPTLRDQFSDLEDEVASGHMSAAEVLTRVRSWFDLSAKGQEAPVASRKVQRHSWERNAGRMVQPGVLAHRCSNCGLEKSREGSGWLYWSREEGSMGMTTPTCQPEAAAPAPSAAPLTPASVAEAIRAMVRAWPTLRYEGSAGAEFAAESMACEVAKLLPEPERAAFLAACGVSQ